MSDLIPRIIGAVFFTAYSARIVLLQAREWSDASGAVPIDDIVARAFVIVMFLLMAASYVLRLRARVKAVGFYERFFPFLCAALPIAVNESSSYFPHLAGESSARNVMATAVLFFGNAISVWGLIYLRKCFSIMAEVRVLVSRGPYRFVRHPIYAGQILSTAGVWLLAPTWIGAALLLAFAAAQHARATFEERKLADALPEYGPYRDRTGAYFPRANRMRSSKLP